MIIQNGKDLKITPFNRCVVIGLASLGCLLVYVSSQILFSLFSSTFRNLPVKERMFWNLAVVRGSYGFIGTLFSIYERYFEPDLKLAEMNSKTQISSILILTHLGFFIFEWCAQTYFDIRYKVFNKALHLHHLICFVGYVSSVVTQMNYYYACSGFILEMTTPFSCICYVLIKCKLENTFAWKANQMLLIHLFHMRSVIEFSMIYEYLYYFEYFKVLPIISHIQINAALFGIAFFLTPYWTYRKTEQLFTKSDWSNKDKEA